MRLANISRLLSPAQVVLLQKSWQAMSGFVTALLVTYFLSPVEQGYYYAFGSLLTAATLLDLGLGALLVQVSARMFPGLQLLAEGVLVPVGRPRTAFLAMIAWSKRWYVRTCAISLLLVPIGFLYFANAKSGLPDLQWQLPWVAIVVVVAFGMPAYPAQSIIEGTGRVAEVYWVRLGHFGLGALLAWILLASGYGLFAPAAAPLALGLVTFWWLKSRYSSLFVAAVADPSQFSWHDSVWPLQRKVAVFWLSAYLFLNSPTLVVFYFSDALSAGQLGLSTVIVNLLGSLCASWMIAKIPRMTHLVAEDRHLDSHRMFLTEFRKAFLLMVFGYAVAMLLVMLLAETSIGRRILPPFELLILLGVFLIYHCIGMLSVYFRARGHELLAAPAMLATAVGLAISVLVVRDHGVLGVLVAFLGAYSLIAVPGMLRAWTNSRDR